MFSVILDRIEERKSSQAFISSKETAVQIFEQQQSALMGIRGEPGFQIIRDYWLSIVDACVTRLSSTKKGELPVVQAELKIARDFLEFLDSRQVYEEVQK